VRIGTATKLAEMADSDLLKKRYPMLVEAIHMISSPELRNVSTLGGDLLQEVWCQYLRGGYACWRNGGTCATARSAITAITIPQWEAAVLRRVSR